MRRAAVVGGESDLIRAGGAIVWRPRVPAPPRTPQPPQGSPQIGPELGVADLEVAIVHRPRYHDWSWPKGKVEPGESVPGAAVREVAEETGVEVVLGLPLPSSHYRVGGRPKKVWYWLAEPVTQLFPAVSLHRLPAIRNVNGGGSAGDTGFHLPGRPAWQRASKKEIDRVRWVPLAQAEQLLTSQADKQLARKAGRLLADARVRTGRTVVVVRHGKAMKRPVWQGQAGHTGPLSDQLRPLTAVGHAQAQALVGTLSAFGVGRVVSSPAVRCVDTVRPFAEAAGLDLQLEPAFSEESFATHPQRTAAVWAAILEEYLARSSPVQRLAAPAGTVSQSANPSELAGHFPNKNAGGGPATAGHCGALALCSHRPVLPTLVRQLFGAAAAQLGDPLAVGETIIGCFTRVTCAEKPQLLLWERHRS